MDGISVDTKDTSYFYYQSKLRINTINIKCSIEISVVLAVKPSDQKKVLGTVKVKTNKLDLICKKLKTTGIKVVV